jgi:hypothetical protein
MPQVVLLLATCVDIEASRLTLSSLRFVLFEIRWEIVIRNKKICAINYDQQFHTLCLVVMYTTLHACSTLTQVCACTWNPSITLSIMQPPNRAYSTSTSLYPTTPLPYQIVVRSMRSMYLNTASCVTREPCYPAVSLHVRPFPSCVYRKECYYMYMLTCLEHGAIVGMQYTSHMECCRDGVGFGVKGDMLRGAVLSAIWC